MTSSSCSTSFASNSTVTNSSRKSFSKSQESVRWGEYTDTIPDSEHDDDATKVIISDILKKCLIPDPVQEKKQDLTHNLNLTENVIHSRMDSKVLHQLQLNNFYSTVSEMVEEVTNASGDVPKSFTSCPPLPQNPNLQPKKIHSFLSHDVTKQDTDFSLGISKPKIDISLQIAKQLLYKSVGTLSCHAGFEESDRITLEVFTDVADQLLHSICSRLRVAVDQEVTSGESGFHDAIERVFTEMNLGTIEELLSFYQENVVEPNLITIKKCKSLARSYSQLVKSKCEIMQQETDQEDEAFLGSDDKGDEMEDDDDDDDDVPEIHFPALDEEDQIGLQPSLEPGFQMLDSLEHDETLQNLEPEEEINVSDSPSQDYAMGDVSEQANSSDGTKAKKRQLRK